MNRIDSIKLYKAEKTLKELRENISKQNEIDLLIGKVKLLQPRIAECIKVGNACLENGIALCGISWGGHEYYDTHQFVSNGWSHVVGFIHSNNSSNITTMGIMAGGACGKWNFITDGYIAYDTDGNVNKQPSVQHLKRFVNTFDEFEREFYAYVDRLTSNN